MDGSTYTLAVRAKDSAGRASEEKTARAFVDTTPPTVAAGSAPCATRVGDAVKVSWGALFAEAVCGGGSCLRYEVSVGATDEASDLVAPMLVDDSSTQFPEGLLEPGATKVFVAITAINGAGLGTTRRYDSVELKAEVTPCTN